MAIGQFPIEALLQAMQMKERNRQQAMADAQGVGKNIAGMGKEAVAAAEMLKKKRAQEQLINALQQPGQLPMQGPLQPEMAPFQGPSLPGMDQMPPSVLPSGPQPGQMGPGAMPERQMVQNPQADIMGPLMQLYPDMLQKSLEAQINPLTQSEIYKNMRTGQGTDTNFSPDVMQAAEEGNYPQIASLSGGKGISSKLLPFMSQAMARKGVQGRADESNADRDLNRQLRIDKGIADIGIRIDSHPMIKKLKEQEFAIDQVSTLIEMARSGNTVSAAAMGLKMAKAMGEVGVMTDADIRRYVESGKLSQAAADKLSKWIKGKPSKATLDEIEQISNAMKGSFNKKVQPIYDRHVNLLSRNYGLSQEDAAFRLDVPYSGVTGKKVADDLKPKKDSLGIL